MKFFSYLLLVLLIGACSKRLLTKEQVREYNEFFSDKVYLLKEDIKNQGQEPILKGTVVKIYIEATDSLLKIKCLPLEEPRESSIGRLAVYVENSKQEKKKWSLAEIEEILDTKFQETSESFPKKKKK